MATGYEHMSDEQFRAFIASIGPANLGDDEKAELEKRDVIVGRLRDVLTAIARVDGGYMLVDQAEGKPFDHMDSEPRPASLHGAYAATAQAYRDRIQEIIDGAAMVRDR